MTKIYTRITETQAAVLGALADRCLGDQHSRQGHGCRAPQQNGPCTSPASPATRALPVGGGWTPVPSGD